MTYDPSSVPQPSPDPFTPPPDEPGSTPDPGSPAPPPNVPIITDVPEQLPDQQTPTL